MLEAAILLSDFAFGLDSKAETLCSVFPQRRSDFVELKCVEVCVCLCVVYAIICISRPFLPVSWVSMTCLPSYYLLLNEGVVLSPGWSSDSELSSWFPLPCRELPTLRSFPPPFEIPHPVWLWVQELAFEPVTYSHLVFFSYEQGFHFLNQNSSPSWSKGRKPGEKRENAHRPLARVSGEHWAAQGVGGEKASLRCWGGRLLCWPQGHPVCCLPCDLPALHLHSSFFLPSLPHSVLSHIHRLLALVTIFLKDQARMWK